LALIKNSVVLISVIEPLGSSLLKIMTKHGFQVRTWGNFMELFHTKWLQLKEHCFAFMKMEAKDSVALLVTQMKMTP